MARKSRAISAIRALFGDATRAIEDVDLPDPLPEAERNGIRPGQWPGAPVQGIPPDCPVTPLGKTGKVSYYVDTLGQLTDIAARDWSDNLVMDLFALTPNFPLWAWPRWSEPKKDKPSRINGLNVREARAALVRAAALRGSFDPAEKVRGRGGWMDRHGRFIWHSGDRLWTVHNGRLEVSRTGQVDDIFYPRRPAILKPWEEPVDEAESPVQELLRDLRTWSFERTALDPFLVVGGIACALMGGALEWRPTLFTTGGHGAGKSSLMGVIKGTLGDAMVATADTTAAGIYQRINQDTLPVAVDELEADPNNAKAKAVLTLARLASSGALMLRGGQNHAGSEFHARNVFFFAAINAPPLSSAEKSRIGMLNLGRLDQSRIGRAPVVSDVTGRMILRQVMDAWPRFAPLLASWKQTLFQAGFDGRAQATYGTLLAAAALVAGDAAMEAAGLPVTEVDDDGNLVKLGALIRAATAAERAEQVDNWRDCMGVLLSSPIEGLHKGGEKPTIGGTLEQFAKGSSLDLTHARERLQLAGLSVRLKEKGRLEKGYWLAVPPRGEPLKKLFAGSVFAGGVWFGALKQAPREVIGRELTVVKINGDAQRCLMVDMPAYGAWCKAEDGEGGAASED